mgnify:CR=1 FL=1
MNIRLWYELKICIIVRCGESQFTTAYLCSHTSPMNQNSPMSSIHDPSPHNSIPEASPMGSMHNSSPQGSMYLPSLGGIHSASPLNAQTHSNTSSRQNSPYVQGTSASPPGPPRPSPLPQTAIPTQQFNMSPKVTANSPLTSAIPSHSHEPHPSNSPIRDQFTSQLPGYAQPPELQLNPSNEYPENGPDDIGDDVMMGPFQPHDLHMPLSHDLDDQIAQGHFNSTHSSPNLFSPSLNESHLSPNFPLMML